MAIEKPHLIVSHEHYGARDISGNYADLGQALGGYTERITKPEEIGPAIRRAQHANADGRAALLEFITSEEISFSLVNGL